jgi:hypothetical protein
MDFIGNASRRTGLGPEASFFAPPLKVHTLLFGG